MATKEGGGNEHVIAGSRHVVCLVKPPASLDAAGTHLVANLDRIGLHPDGPIVQVTPETLSQLRRLGAEVLVIDADANDYAARVRDAESPQALIASIDERLEAAREDLKIARAGPRSGGKKA